MSITAAERLMTELKSIRKNRNYMFFARPSENNLMTWDCGFPAKNGFFCLKLFFTKDFPFSPPVAKFNDIVYHPNVFTNNTVCLDVLASKWKPCMTIERILYALKTLIDEPNILSPANVSAANDFKNDFAKYAKKESENIKKYHSTIPWEFSIMKLDD